MNAERVTLPAEEIRAQLIENGMSPEVADSHSLDIARKILEGPTAGIAIDTDLDSLGMVVMGTLQFHFCIGQEFKPEVIGELARMLIIRVQRISDLDHRAPFPFVLGAVSAIRGRIVTDSNGQVWGVTSA